MALTKLPEPVIDRQLERTELTHPPIGQPQADTILAAGLALQQAGVIPPDTNVKAAVDALIDQPLHHRGRADDVDRGRAP